MGLITFVLCYVEVTRGDNGVLGAYDNGTALLEICTEPLILEDMCVALKPVGFLALGGDSISKSFRRYSFT